MGLLDHDLFHQSSISNMTFVSESAFQVLPRRAQVACAWDPRPRLTDSPGLSWTLQDQCGNLLPNRKFRNLSSPNILQKSQESRPQPMIQRKSRENPIKIPGFVVPRLGQLSLLGEKEPQSRLLQATRVQFCHISCQTRHIQYTQVYNLVGSLYCEHVVPLYFPVRG